MIGFLWSHLAPAEFWGIRVDNSRSARPASPSSATDYLEGEGSAGRE